MWGNVKDICAFAHLNILICVHFCILTFFLEGRYERFAERGPTLLELTPSTDVCEAFVDNFWEYLVL